MGREIRRVPPNWEHPKRENGSYQPLYDESAINSFNEWVSEYHKFITDELESVALEQGYDVNNPYAAFCDWAGGPPDHEYYRPNWKEESATWWQVYETVTEGTPVSPPFETPEELINYLVEHGDFWDHKRRKEGRCMGRCDPWARANAEKFVLGAGWAPSFVAVGGEMKTGVELMAETSND